MSGEFAVYLIVALAVVVGALAVWLLDARRNKEVEHDPERLDPEPLDPPDPRNRGH